MTAITSKLKSCKAKCYHHGDLRHELFSAARILLEEGNIASLSLRAVAKRVGVSHTAPYRHFKDKESLLAAIAAIGFDELLVAMADAVTLHPKDPVKQISEAGHKYVEYVIANPQCSQLMFGNLIPCDGTYPSLRESGDLAFEGLKKIIENGQLQGVFKTGEVELMALTAWSGMHGLSLLFSGGHVESTVSSLTELRALTSAVTATMLEGFKA